jgi:hypothetical protein
MDKNKNNKVNGFAGVRDVVVCGMKAGRTKPQIRHIPAVFSDELSDVLMHVSKASMHVSRS